MKQNDPMQPSILQQNFFFENLSQQDITQYELKKPSKAPFVRADNSNSKPRRHKNTKKISPFINKLNKQSLTVKIPISNLNQDNNPNYYDKENSETTGNLNSQQNLQQLPQSFTHKEPSQQIPEFYVLKPQNIEKQLMQQQKSANLKPQGHFNQIQKPQGSKPSGDKLEQRATQKVLQQKRSINLCLSLADSDSDHEGVSIIKQKSSKQDNLNIRQKNKFKKIHYLNRKSINSSQNTFPLEAILSVENPTNNKKQQEQNKIQRSSLTEMQLTSSAQNHVLKESNLNPQTQQSKPLLLSFDQQDKTQQGNQSQSSQDFEYILQVPKSTKKTPKSLSPNSELKKPQVLIPKLKKSNNKQQKILLNDFDDQSSSESSQSLSNCNPILLKTSSINSCRSISSNEDQISLTRPINILELSRMVPTLTYVYESIPPNCIFQSIIKRYQQPNENNIVYEMFDHSTYKSILKVKNVEEGFQILSSKQSLAISSIGNSKSLPQSNDETSCALLSSNFFGTQFNCFKFNRNNQKPDKSKLNRLITINYETNLFGLNGPRKMQAYIPGSKYLVRGEKNLQQAYESEKQLNPKEPAKIQFFVNRKPKWNSEISSFVLNFNGRATVSSVKNFIITRPADDKSNFQCQDSLVLFGKVEKNVFNLDIKHPFNLVQGFALALSSFDRKIACE